MKIFFLGWKAQYEKLFIAHLAENYEVTHLAQSKVLNRMDRIARRIFGRWVSFFLGRIYGRGAGFSANDLLVCNEGEVHRKLNPYIIELFPGAKVLLVRDLVSSKFIERWASVFDAIYSFDREQCEKLGMTYLPQFFPMGHSHVSALTGSSNALTARALFIGREKGRGEILLRLADVLTQCGCDLDFRILVDEAFPDKTKHHITQLVDYRESLEASLKANVLVEINQAGQSGFTLRTLEAAYFGKKLVTNNKAVYESVFYDPSNVYVFDENQPMDLAEIKAFLSRQVRPVPLSVIYECSPEHMLETLMLRHGSEKVGYNDSGFAR
ncbi:hypothetical protein M1D96_01505 [Pseudomonas sp. D1-3]